jgi:hypothetical protein
MDEASKKVRAQVGILECCERDGLSVITGTGSMI